MCAHAIVLNGLALSATSPDVLAALTECAQYPTIVSAITAGMELTALYPYAPTVAGTASVRGLTCVNAMEAGPEIDAWFPCAMRVSMVIAQLLVIVSVTILVGQVLLATWPTAQQSA